jgi:hypothetical protein
MSFHTFLSTQGDSIFKRNALFHLTYTEDFLPKKDCGPIKDTNLKTCQDEF